MGADWRIGSCTRRDQSRELGCGAPVARGIELDSRGALREVVLDFPQQRVIWPDFSKPTTSQSGSVARAVFKQIRPLLPQPMIAILLGA